MADIKDVINTLDEAIDGFEKVVGASQAEMYKELLVLMKDLETSNGHVKQTIHNLKLLTAIKAKLGKIANNDKYISGVERLIGFFDKLQGQQNDYFSRNFAEQTLDIEAKKKHDLMKQMAVQNTINALTDDGLKAGVTDKINDILLRAVTTGAKFGDLQEELRAHMLGKEGGQGALARYATTYATTSISQFTGQNNKLLTQDLGMQWFMYVGSNIETTREFCQHLTKKRYIHISEIPTILSGKIDDHQCAIYPKTKLPYGMIEGTNEENFQVNCGGWNCRHQLVPVHELAVPADIRNKIFIEREEGKRPIIAKIEYTEKDPDLMRQQLIKSESINQMFENGTFDSLRSKAMSASGETDKHGNIWISSERMGELKEAFDKIANGEFKTASYREQYVMYTLWHEMWHNKHKIQDGETPLKRYSEETDYMEMANEFVARNTITRLYDYVGVGQDDRPSPLMRRRECGYDDWVVAYEKVIDFLQLNKNAVISYVESRLKTDMQNTLFTVLADALEMGGLVGFVYTSKRRGIVEFTRQNLEFIIKRCKRDGADKTIISEISAEFPLLKKDNATP